MAAVQPSILPDHVLSAVLVLAKQQLQGNAPRLAFRSHDFELQEIFHDLQESGKYPILKQAFVFSDRGPEPYSPSLGESVSRLQLSGLIGRENPEYEVVFVQPAAEQFFSEVLAKEFDGQELQQLKSAASEFLKRVKVVK